MVNKTAIDPQKVLVINRGGMSTANGPLSSYSHWLYSTEENVVQSIGAAL